MLKNMKFPKFVRFVCMRVEIKLKCINPPPPAEFISERYKQVLQHGTGCFGTLSDVGRERNTPFHVGLLSMLP